MAIQPQQGPALSEMPRHYTHPGTGLQSVTPADPRARVSVSQVGGKWASIGWRGNASTNSSRGRATEHDLTAQREAEAQRLFEAPQRPSLDEARRLARLLAGKHDGQLLGKTEFEARDAAHRLGAQALQAALDGREKGGTRAPA